MKIKINGKPLKQFRYDHPWVDFVMILAVLPPALLVFLLYLAGIVYILLNVGMWIFT